jgi:hypothetical protein
MIKPLIKVIREWLEGNSNTGCYSPPPLKEISSWDLRREVGSTRMMKNNSMIEVNQGVHLVENEQYATLLKKVKQGFETTRKSFWPTISKKQ